MAPTSEEEAAEVAASSETSPGFASDAVSPAGPSEASPDGAAAPLQAAEARAAVVSSSGAVQKSHSVSAMVDIVPSLVEAVREVSSVEASAEASVVSVVSAEEVEEVSARMYAAMRAALESPEGVALALWWAVEAADEAGVRRAAQRGADLDAPAGQALVAAHGGGAPQSNGSNDSGSNGNGSNGKSALDSNGSNGTGAWESQTPLHAAAARGYVKVIRALAECGANVNACNARGFTPLHFAAFHSRTLAAVTLVELGADLLARNFVPQAGGARLTPVDVAAGDTATVLLKLMKVKARVAAEGSRPLPAEGARAQQRAPRAPAASHASPHAAGGRVPLSGSQRGTPNQRLEPAPQGSGSKRGRGGA